MKEIVDSFCFDDSARFVIKDFSIKRPFSSFLPGIAGPLGIPMWVFYVNRGQAIASFGIGNKNNPIMMFGERPFFVKNEQLHLAFEPILPGWLFTEDGKIRFKFLGKCTVTYHNLKRLDTFKDGLLPRKIVLHTEDRNLIEVSGHVIGPPYATMVRDGQIVSVDIFFIDQVIDKEC